MAETAAHLVDHVIPHVPVRQFVLSVPKRLRPFLHHRPRTASAVLHILLRALQATLRKSSPTAPPDASFGAVSFLHRFGSSLNPHFHFHLCVVDGLFEKVEGDTGQARTTPCARLHFHEATALTPQLLERLQHTVRRRVLRHVHRTPLCFARWSRGLPQLGAQRNQHQGRSAARHGLLETHDAKDMLAWDHGGGFSLDASVRIEATDRAGLERLIRYCARPPFALDRLHLIDGRSDQILYLLPEPDLAGRTALRLSALEFLDRVAKILPPPRIHRHRYHGAFAPNAPLRPLVTERAREDNARAAQVAGLDGLPAAAPEVPSPIPEAQAPTEETPDTTPSRPSRWAALLARIYEVFPLVCPTCQTPLTFIAFASPYCPPPASPTASSASLRFSPTRIPSPTSSPTSESPLHPRSSIPPGGRLRPSSAWAPAVEHQKSPPGNPSPTTSTKRPDSIPLSRNLPRKTISIRPGTPDPRSPPGPPQARPDSPKTPPPDPRPHPTHRSFHVLDPVHHLPAPFLSNLRSL